jgi:RimJ/RimL family protein N-acetyltransferase
VRPDPIVSERLALRSRARCDIDDILRMDLDPEVHRYSHINSINSNEPVSVARNALRREIRKQILSQSPGDFWVIEWNDRPGLLGLIGLSLATDLSFRLPQENWGQGIATEAAQTVCEHLFNVRKLPVITAFVHKDNQRSRRVLEKIGMKPNGIAATRRRSVLEKPETPRSGDFLKVNSTTGNLYVTYGLELATYRAQQNKASMISAADSNRGGGAL